MRQLVNVIEQCVALTSSPVIGDALVEQALEGENTALPTFVEARNQLSGSLRRWGSDRICATGEWTGR